METMRTIEKIPLQRILIANRGEIAVRILRTLRKMGKTSIVLLSHDEKNTLPANLADEVIYLEGNTLQSTFLNIPNIINLARTHAIDAIHPGYGFLSENYTFAEACQQAGVEFIGPAAKHLHLMGDKLMALKEARKAGIPTLKNWEGTANELLANKNFYPYPVLIKAAMGGGGKGMLLAHTPEELPLKLKQAARQAETYFSDARLFLEQYIERPRHIEVQVLADKQGNTLHLFERECSIQRNFQKVIEEAPAPNLPDSVRQQLHADALKLVTSLGYQNAGTIEFILDDQRQYFFLEMNTRIQVEHPVTEEITGLDLIELQIRIAEGYPLSYKQNQIKINGHAMEARLYAEDPAKNYQPTPGEINQVHWPHGASRVDTYFNDPITLNANYDPMLAKLIVKDQTREAAIQKMHHALLDTYIGGIVTNQHLLHQIVNHPVFKLGSYNTLFIDQHQTELITDNTPSPSIEIVAAYAAIRFSPVNGNTFWRLTQHHSFSCNSSTYAFDYQLYENDLNLSFLSEAQTIRNIHLTENTVRLDMDNKNYLFFYNRTKHLIEIIYMGLTYTIIPGDYLPDYHPSKQEDNKHAKHLLKAPIPGQIIRLNVQEGEKIKKGDVLVVLEAMKTENHLKAWRNGIVEQTFVYEGKQVLANDELLLLK
jgi:acetyl/propionyl-CoA carboxylase alpha subunit